MARSWPWIVCVLCAPACSPEPVAVGEPAVVAEKPEAGGMWSGTYAFARPHDVPARVTAGQRTLFPATLTDLERRRVEEVAWSALRSPESWARYFKSPASAAELALSENGVRIYAYRQDPGLVDVAIPSGATIGWHPTYIGVTVDRATGEVLDMYESCWW